MILSRPQRKRIRDIARGRSDEALRVLEGPKAIHDAIALGVVAEVWLREDLEEAAVAETARAAGVPVGRGSRADFGRMADTVTPQGALALVRDTAGTLDALCAASGLLLWLDGVQDPGNVGAVIRVAAAFGAAGVLVGTGTADPLGLKALRASAGLALRVPFARAATGDIAGVLAEAGRPLWALVREGRSVFGVEAVPENIVLAIGSEGRGIGPEIQVAAADRIGIQMAPGVDSLNVAVSAGIAVAVLQRRADAGAP